MARINTLGGGFTGHTSMTATSKSEPEYIGAIMAFAQATAPVGWVKQTTYNDYAIRIVSGTAGSGGSTDFSSTFTTQIPFGTSVSGSWPLTVGTTTISTATMQNHTHQMGVNYSGGTLYGGSPSSAPYYTGPYSKLSTISPYTSGSTSSGTGHTHTASLTSVDLSNSIDLTIKYLDTLLARY